jgi:hypothetical protein
MPNLWYADSYRHTFMDRWPGAPPTARPAIFLRAVRPNGPKVNSQGREPFVADDQ